VSDIDELLALRSQHGKDEAGTRVTADYVLGKMGEWGVTNPIKANLTSHWKLHREYVTQEQVDKSMDVVLKKIEDQRDGDSNVDIDEDLHRMWAIGKRSIEAKIAAGQNPGITVDHMLKISDALVRRGVNVAQAELMKALGGGIEQVFKKALGPGSNELPEGVEPIIDGEVTEVTSEDPPESE
jgi:hypothetical protein